MKRGYMILFIEIFVSLLLKSLMIYNYYQYRFPYVYLSLFVAVLLFLRLFKYMADKQYKDCQSIIDFVIKKKIKKKIHYQINVNILYLETFFIYLLLTF